MPEFKIGDKVRLAGKDELYGCVAGVREDNNHDDYYDYVIERADGYGWERDKDVDKTYQSKYSNKYWFTNYNEVEKIEENITIKESKNIMSKALDFVKELTLSSDEKLLRKWGLKDNEGNYTDDAEVIITNKLIEDNKAHLLSIAQGLEDKEKASK